MENRTEQPRFSAEDVLKAAIEAMIHGHHEPHCYHAHVVGHGYVNNGLDLRTRPDYLRQLRLSAESELENMGFAPSYAEPGYTQPAVGVLFANWNVFPSYIDKTLEQLGYAVEWSDEWTTCDDCQRAIRTSPDSYGFTPSYADIDGGTLCLDCLQEWAESARQNEREETEETTTD